MSALNGDRARFRKNRRRKLAHRQRIWALMARLRAEAGVNAARVSDRRVSVADQDQIAAGALPSS
jgi:hypothetical protein